MVKGGYSVKLNNSPWYAHLHIRKQPKCWAVVRCKHLKIFFSPIYLLNGVGGSFYYLFFYIEFTLSVAGIIHQLTFFDVSWCIIENGHSFEWNEDRITLFLKWTDLSWLPNILTWTKLCILFLVKKPKNLRARPRFSDFLVLSVQPYNNPTPQMPHISSFYMITSQKGRGDIQIGQHLHHVDPQGFPDKRSHQEENLFGNFLW